MPSFTERWRAYVAELRRADVIQLELLAAGRQTAGECASSLWYSHQAYALDALQNGSVNEARQNFYVCAQLDAFAIEHGDSRILDAGVANVSYALLSDAIPLIHRYAGLKHSQADKILAGGTGLLPRAMQEAARNNDAGLALCIDLLDRRCKTQTGRVNTADRDFFKALRTHDAHHVTMALATLLSAHKKRNKHPLIVQLISHPAVGYAKLAWMYGLEVEIDSPLIPKELLPIRPLQNYVDPYDFLKA